MVYFCLRAHSEHTEPCVTPAVGDKCVSCQTSELLLVSSAIFTDILLELLSMSRVHSKHYYSSEGIKKRHL